MNRTLLITELADLLAAHSGLVASQSRPHPLRVAIDGVDTAGKTSLADELAPRLMALGQPVLRTSIDGFHNPAAIRRQRGPDSPEGYFQDSFDYTILKENLLDPLGPGGNRRIRTAAFNYRTDSPVDLPWVEMPASAILLFDGVFLLRPELAFCWDFSIFLEINVETMLERAVQRDRPLFGSAETARQRYTRRYIPGQQIYLQTCRPQARADIVIDNNDLQSPSWIKRPSQSD